MRLSRRARIVLDTLLPSGAHPALPLGAFDAGFDDFFSREFEKSAMFSMRLGFHLALFVAAWIAPILAGRFPPITRFDRPERERILTVLARSRVNGLRQMIIILKMTVSFSYGANAAVRDAIGVPR